MKLQWQFRPARQPLVLSSPTWQHPLPPSTAHLPQITSAATSAAFLFVARRFSTATREGLLLQTGCCFSEPRCTSNTCSCFRNISHERFRTVLAAELYVAIARRCVLRPRPASCNQRQCDRLQMVVRSRRQPIKAGLLGNLTAFSAGAATALLLLWLVQRHR